MAVRMIFTFQVHPGRRKDFLTRQAELKKLAERHGAKTRYWQSDLAGQNSGNVSSVSEFDDYAAFAKFRDALYADPEYQAFLERVQADPNPPATMVARASANEVIL